jgi:hypothetical protein
MDATMYLLAAVPFIILAAVLYGVLAELRHNRTRRTRWELEGDRWDEAAPVRAVSADDRTAVPAE